jgi:hypothetical protein
MTLPSLAKPPPDSDTENLAKWIIVGVLAVSALFTIMVTRQLTGPLDGLLTQQVCSAHGEEINRPVTGYERARRFVLTNRSEGACFNGAPIDEDSESDGATDEPVVEEDPTEIDTLVVPLTEAEPGGLYRAGKLMALVLQLGAASAVVRFLADPLFDRFVRRPE